MSSDFAHAEIWRAREDGSIVCDLCPHHCRLFEGETGICRTRRNVGGSLRVLTFGKLAAASADPVEKKPLFHYHPGSRTFSVATMGCNLVCPFCQNHHLSSGPVHRGERVAPASVVRAALDEGCRSIAFTYSEPVLMFEYALEVAPIARESGIELVFVTNGQASRKAAAMLGEILHAANVDLKCFSAERYRTVLGGELQATLRTIEQLAAAGVWVEVTTLVIPGFNDSDVALREIAAFITGVDPDIPWHVSRYHPAHTWLEPGPTPVETLSRAKQIGVAEGLKFVYTGNVPGDDGENTRCPACQSIAITRRGYRIVDVALSNGCCVNCGEVIAGRGMP